MDFSNLFKNSDNAIACKAGATIFAEGAPGDVMYVVLEGEVEVKRENRVLHIVRRGELIGEMALIDSRSRSATAIARTDCRLTAVNERRFLQMVQQTPAFALEVMRVLVERLRQMNAKIYGG